MPKTPAEVRLEVQAEVNTRRREGKGIREDVPPGLWRMPDVHRAMDAAINHCLAEYPGEERLDFEDDVDLTLLIDEVGVTLDDFTRDIPTYVLPAPRPLTPPRCSAPSVGLGAERGDAGSRMIEVPFPPTKENFFDVIIKNFSIPQAVEMMQALTAHLASGRTNMADLSVAAAALIRRYLKQDAEVRRFRREALHGKSFENTEEGLDKAWNFITSPLVKVLSVENFKDMGLCPTTAQGRFQPDQRHSIFSGLTPMSARIRPKSAEDDTLVLDFVVEAFEPGEGETCGEKWAVTHEMSSYVCIGESGFATYQPLTVHCGRARADSVPFPSRPPWFNRHSSEPSQFVEGYTGSIAGWAIAIVGRLLTQFPADAWQLLEFLLADRPPVLAPILAGRRPYRPIIITDDKMEETVAFEATGPMILYVQPWVQPEVLADFWRYTRDSKARNPQQESLEMFDFALKHTASDERFRWQELVKEWEKEHDHIGGDNPRATFRNTFMRIRETLFPGFRDPREDGRSNPKDK